MDDYYNNYDDGSDNGEKSLTKRIANQIISFIVLLVIFSIGFSFLQPIVYHSKTELRAAQKERETLEQGQIDAKETIEKQKEELISQQKDLEKKNYDLKNELDKLNWLEV